jgi:hypothetical protein
MDETSTPELMDFSINSDELFQFAEQNLSAEPRQHVIDSILRFSRSLEIRPSSMIGKFESVTN